MNRKFRIAQIQMSVAESKTATISYLKRKMEEICDGTVDFICLPEMFCCPYRTELFPQYAEPEGGELWTVCSELAARHNVYFSAGTMPEEVYLPEDEESDELRRKIYNTAYIFDRKGQQIAKHRKMHLYEIHPENKKSFREADTLSAGSQMTLFDTEFGKGGLCVCFDIRFVELIRLMALSGAEFLVVPAAFNMVTGPKSWELVLRSQASYNQIFVFGTSLARDPSCGFISWGHSLSADPWGMIVGQTDEKESVVISDIDLSVVDSVRKQLPLLTQRREDIYRLQIL